MLDLGSTLTELGRHREALMLQQETVEFYRRVLAHNHPKIGAEPQFEFLLARRRNESVRQCHA